MLTRATSTAIRNNVVKRTLNSSIKTLQNQKNEDKFEHDLIGPPDTASNLRPIQFKVSENETELQTRLRLLRQETQEFNQTFWVQHNAEFTSGREEHIAQVLKEKYENDVAKTTISAEEMSVYYKKFLDSKWRSHIDYNLEWQKRNFSILFLAFRVQLESLISKK